MAEVVQPKVEVIITIAEECKGNLKQITSELQGLGLDITYEALESLGMICGKAPEKSLGYFKIVKGVVAVEKAGSVQLLSSEANPYQSDR
ncbi:MAG: hypothetical protein VKO00_07285 [Cyanobacteriota bacterium]|nr:hypothetical protein [Cyanobacteriota bacterium]